MCEYESDGIDERHGTRARAGETRPSPRNIPKMDHVWVDVFRGHTRSVADRRAEVPVSGFFTSAIVVPSP